jgi:uncharacterized membrane protein
MKQATAKLDAVTLGVIGAGALLTLAVYFRLPDPMPTHFNARGIPNGWMPRAVGAWIVPAVAVGVWALNKALGTALLAPRDRGEPSVRRGLALAVAISTILLMSIQLLMLRAALGSSRLPMGIAWILLGAFFVALAQVLPRLRRNPLIGIRTPFTLTSDENWARVHRVASYTMTIGGIVAIAAGLQGATGLALSAVVLSAVAPAVYSYVLARKLPPAT